MTPAEFWGSIRASGKTAEQELVELWQRMRDCVRPQDRVTTKYAPTGGAVTPGSPGSQIGLSEWLRRRELQDAQAAEEGLVDRVVDDAITKRKVRRRREEELLLLLS